MNTAQLDAVAVLHDMPSTPIPIRKRVPASVRKLADRLWVEIEKSLSYRPHGKDKKKKFWRSLCHAGTRAVHAGGAVRYSRDKNKCPQSHMRVIRCAVEAGLFQDFRARPTNRQGARQSCLVPTARFRRHVPSDPWILEPPPATRPLVVMRCRENRGQKKIVLPFDFAHPIEVETRQIMDLVNEVNSAHAITYKPDHVLYIAQLRPFHWALFHRNWQHGRIYFKRRGGNKSLTTNERASILIDGGPSIELDYSATHIRLAYHLSGFDCPDDPYRIWGDATTDAQRQLAKLVVNIGLNAKTHNAAIGACCQRVRLKTKSGEWKQGKARRKALQLREAISEIVGLSAMTRGFFKRAGVRALIVETYDLAVNQNEPIADWFGDDSGVCLMTVESRIALDVLHCMVAQGIPVIGVHDSFVVPETHRPQLEVAMKACWYERVRFVPVVNAKTRATRPNTDDASGSDVIPNSEAA